jgi:hypothetical protein
LKDDIRRKIEKLEALIASTMHEGERQAGLLAKERLLKKLRGKEKYQKTYNKRKTTHHKKKRRRQREKESSQENAESTDYDDIDGFFFEAEVCRRHKSDTKDATQPQKNYILYLLSRAELSCPIHILDQFLSSLGIGQASRIIDILLERFGDPRDEPLTDNQFYFLKNHRGFQLSDDTIEKLTVSKASLIIEAIKVVEKLKI